MKEYAIEYADYSVLTRLGFIVGGCFLILVASVTTLSSNEMVLAWGAVGGILIVLAYLLLNPSKIRKSGIILMNDDRIVFGMASGVRIIDLPELAKYRITHQDGPKLTLVLKNGNKFQIVANDNFCDTSKLEQACNDIERTLHKLKLT